MTPATEIALSVAWLAITLALAVWLRADTPIPTWSLF